MNFFLARSFTRALERLDKQDAALAKRAALDFQIDPSQPGFKFHRVNNARDRKMWSFRINRDLRAIVHHEGDAFILCYVDHHDDAYAWAERHRIEQHPTTKQTQIVEVIERTEVVTRTVYDDQTVVLPPLFEASPELLLAIGVPTEWVDWVRTASEEALVDHIERFPEEVQHNLLELLTGGAVAPPARPSPVDVAEITPSREIVPIEDGDALSRALDSPWEQWLVFLHPEQREVAERSYSGSARIFGSAGTGKTIVALHRVKWLLDRYEDEPILFTTYTHALTANLAARAALLLGEDYKEDYPNLLLTNFHRWLTSWHRARFGQMDIATEQDIARLIEEGKELYPDTPFEDEFILSEFKAIIDPYHVTARKAYFDIPRTGRGTPLGKRQKMLLWKIFEHVLTRLEETNQRTLNQYSGVCVEYFEQHPEERPFTRVVVDEAQDFSPIELRALRAIAPVDEDDIFLCSDAGQRLYGRAFSWLKNGLDIRGRSHQLHVNYRTTEQIRAACEALLPNALEGPSGDEEARRARSLRRGSEIELVGCKTSRAQQDALQSWLSRLVDERGVAPDQIAVLARTTKIAMRIGAEAARTLELDYSLLESGGASRGGVAIGSMKNAKGLEYRAVAIVECDAQTVPLKEELERAAFDQGDIFDVLEMERNLLYVAGTRARDELLISYVGEPSEFLSLLVDPPEPAPKPPLPEIVNVLPEERARVQEESLPDPRVVAASLPEVKLDHTPPDVPAREASKAPRGAAQFKLSPSRIAQYFGFDCQRYIRFSSAWSEARVAADRIPEADPPRAYSQAIYDSGYAWEEEVLTEILDPGVVHIASGPADVTERYFNPEQTVEVLREALPGTFIYEMTLVAPPRFYARFGLDPMLVQMSRCRPDLVQVLEAPEGSEYSRIFRVIDMKRSTSIHATHHIQLAMYAILLEEVLREASITDARVDLLQGAIWLGGHEEPTICDLSSVYPHVEEFLREGANDIFTRAVESVPWHVYPKCEWCPYLTHCTAEMNATDDVSRLPRLTHQGKQHLRDHGVSTVAEVERVFEDGVRAGEVFDSSATLANRRYMMEHGARALNHDEVVPQGFMARGLTIPTHTEIKIFLTLQRENLGRHTYALGYEIVCARDVPERVVRRVDGDHGAVLVAHDARETANIRRQFVVELYGLLSRVDAYNLGQEWRDQLSVQFFVYSRAEESLLTELLFESMEERETARAASTLLMYFQGPDLILSQEHPEHNVTLPVAVLLDVVGRVVALPIPVAYTLPEMITALDVDVDYPRDALFHHPFTAFLRSDAIFEAWHEDVPARVSDIERHIARNLRAQAALFEKLREIAREEIHTYMPRFALPLAARIRDPLLSKLAFFAQYEASLKCSQVRGQRMMARRAIEHDANTHELVAIDEESFELPAPATRLEASTFKTWLLVRDTPEGRRAQIQYNDFYYRNSFWGGGRRNAHVAVVKITEVTEDALGAITAVKLKATRAFDGDPPKAGESYILYERFSNSLMDRNIAVLEALERRETDLMRRVLTSSSRLPQAPMSITPEVSALGLTPSQERALEHLTRERVLALWGPPGTGKTHFLAVTILALMEAHRAAGEPFRVLIHAFTHAASENVLSKLASLQRERGIFNGELFAGKASGWKGAQTPKGVSNISDKRKIPSWLKKHEQCVIAGTAWAYDKLISGESDFEGVELVVMDEASQIKVPEAAIGMNLTHDTGRVILAGDHLQLPPIVNGTYPEPGEGDVALHRSIFEAVCQIESGRFMKQLQENFRMNRTLTTMSASLLYGEGYRCGSESLAAATLERAPVDGESEFVQTVLSPETSISVVLLHGIAPGKDNELEAELVAEISVALRETSRADDGALFEDDAEFFEHGLFIVSPHHSQIQRIRRQLHRSREWDAEPFVDTVDKMQGQEASAVLVSYGVSDPEFAMMEAEFIYSRNRLNVSVTRGRHKTILLLPAPLLHAPPRILEREEAALGLSYMRRLVSWVRDGQNDAMFLRDGHQIEVWSR